MEGLHGGLAKAMYRWGFTYLCMFKEYPPALVEVKGLGFRVYTVNPKHFEHLYVFKEYRPACVDEVHLVLT